MEGLIRDTQPLRLLVEKRPRARGTKGILGGAFQLTRFVQSYEGEHCTPYVDYVPCLRDLDSYRLDDCAFHAERVHVQRA